MKIAFALVVSCAVLAMVNTQQFENMKVVKLPLDMLSQDQHNPQARGELHMQPDHFQRRGGNKGGDSSPPPSGWGWGPPPMPGWGPPPMMGWGGGPPAYGR